MGSFGLVEDQSCRCRCRAVPLRSMVKGHGELKTAVCAAKELGRMFWQVGQFAIHLSNVRRRASIQKNMEFSTAADLCHTLLGRCSCLQMRSTHTHTHRHTHTNSWQVVAVSLAGHLLVLQSSWSDMISAFQRCRMPPTFFQCFNLLVQNELVGKLFYIVCKTTRKRCLG